MVDNHRKQNYSLTKLQNLPKCVGSKGQPLQDIVENTEDI